MTTAAELVAGATAGAASMAQAMAARISSAAVSDVLAPGLSTVLADLVRVADTISDIDRDTQATMVLVASSPSAVRAAALGTATQLRQVSQTASASTGRVESSYQAGAGSVAANACLANVVRAGLGLVYAATESARQLDQLAGKITV